MALKVILIEPDEKVSGVGNSQNLSHPIHLSQVSETIREFLLEDEVGSTTE